MLAAWAGFLAALIISVVVIWAGPNAEERRFQADRETIAAAQHAAAAARQLAEVQAQPDFEVVFDRYTQMHQRIRVEVAAVVPGLDWPELADTHGSDLNGVALRCLSDDALVGISGRTGSGCLLPGAGLRRARAGHPAGAAGERVG